MADILKAILKINPNAQVTVNADDINQITWENGTTPIAKSEIEAMIPIVEQEIAQAEQDKITAKANAKQKLIDLGLTEEEIKALIGA